MKKLLALLALFVVSLLTVSMVGAADLSASVEVVKMKINGNTFDVGEELYVEEGETLDMDFKLTSEFGIEDVELEVEISGCDEELEDSTDMFDLKAGVMKWVSLSLTLPNELDEDLYLLRVKVTDKNNIELTEEWKLNVNPVEHALEIVDVDFSPGTTVKAGHSLLTTVLVENVGGEKEQDVKVSVEIPELGVKAVDYIDSVDVDDKETTEEELFLRLPKCAAEGDYTVTVTLKYDDGETVSQDFQLHISANDMCKADGNKLILTVGPETQNVVANQQAVYPVALTNAGTSAKSYTLELAVGEWATASLSENLVVLEPGKTAVVYAYLTASEEASAGEKVATLTIKSGDSVLKTLYLGANVVPQDGTSFNLRNGLEIALIVLVVVLVLVGLILGFSRLKKDDLEEGEEKTYY